MHEKLKLAFRRDLPLSESDFGAMVIDGMLALPYDFEPICRVRSVEDSALFVAMVRTDPRAVAAAVGWGVPQVSTAWRGLKQILLPFHGDASASTIPPPPDGRER